MLSPTSFRNSSDKVQNFYMKLDNQIADILETEDVEIEIQLEILKKSNDTRWDSTRILLKTWRENEGKCFYYHARNHNLNWIYFV